MSAQSVYKKHSLTSEIAIVKMLLLHVPPVVKVPHLFSVEIRHSRQVAPLFKAGFLQQLEARLITFQYNGKEMPDLKGRASRQGVLD